MSAPYSTVIDLTSELTGSPYPTTMTGARVDDPSTDVMYFSPNKRVTGKTLPRLQRLLPGRLAPKRRRGPALGVRGRGSSSTSWPTRRGWTRSRSAGRTSPTTGGSACSNAAAAGCELAAARRGLGQADRQRRAPAAASARGTHGTAAYSAAVVDIEVNKKTGKIRATHIYNAMDAGLAVNPDGVENQMTGGSIFGLSRASSRSVNFNKTRVTSLDWVTYPILRFKDAPQVTNVVVSRPDQLPLGTGEPAVVPGSGGGRERVLRRDGRAHPQRPDHTRCRARNAPRGRGRLTERRMGWVLRDPPHPSDAMSRPALLLSSLAVAGALVCMLVSSAAPAATSRAITLEYTTAGDPPRDDGRRRDHPHERGSRRGRLARPVPGDLQRRHARQQGRPARLSASRGRASISRRTWPRGDNKTELYDVVLAPSSVYTFADDRQPALPHVVFSTASSASAAAGSSGTTPVGSRPDLVEHSRRRLGDQ